MDEQLKQKLLYARKLLQQNAPFVYMKFANHKLYGLPKRKPTEAVETNHYKQSTVDQELKTHAREMLNV